MSFSLQSPQQWRCYTQNLNSVLRRGLLDPSSLMVRFLLTAVSTQRSFQRSFSGLLEANPERVQENALNFVPPDRPGRHCCDNVIRDGEPRSFRRKPLRPKAVRWTVCSGRSLVRGPPRCVSRSIADARISDIEGRWTIDVLGSGHRSCRMNSLLDCSRYPAVASHRRSCTGGTDSVLPYHLRACAFDRSP